MLNEVKLLKRNLSVTAFPQEQNGKLNSFYILVGMDLIGGRDSKSTSGIVEIGVSTYRLLEPLSDRIRLEFAGRVHPVTSVLLGASQNTNLSERKKLNGT